ncbi:MAG: hypothetical protein ACU0BB_13035 [Paracoccaceae bacterium]
MRRGGRKDPLYRKVNTRTWGVRHGCHKRNTHDHDGSDDGPTRASMRQGLRHGLDYTPLYRFLISKVGKQWDEVHSEAVSRLDLEDPIWHIVARRAEPGSGRVRAGQSSYYSGLYICEDGFLRLVDPTLSAENMRPFCACCTHTFNGERFGLPFDPNDSSEVQ